MANCDIEVLLDKSVPSSPEEPVYPFGAHVGVVARVVVDEPVVCNDLKLELRYEHTDHVNTQPWGAARPGAHTRSATHSLFKGQWPAGTHEYRATLPIPWPPSYRGHQISWSWAAVVCADIPWASNPIGAARFRVDVPQAVHQQMQYTASEPVRTGGYGEPLSKTLGKYGIVFFSGPMLALLPAVILDAAVGIGALVEPLMISFAVMAEALVLYYFFKARKRANLPGSTLELTFDGASVHCCAQTMAGAPVDYVYLTFGIYEISLRRERGNDNRAVWVPTESKLVENDQRFAADTLDTYTATFPLPDPGSQPYPIGRDTAGRGIVWRVRARIERVEGEMETVTRDIDARPTAPVGH